MQPIMLMQCPQCLAEISGKIQKEECFNCGCIFADVTFSTFRDTVDHSLLTKKPSILNQEISHVHPKELTLGTTIAGRYTIRQPQDSFGLWALYHVVDQEEGQERVLQIGSQAHDMVHVAVDRICSLPISPHLPMIVDRGENPVPFIVFDEQEGESLLMWKRSMPSMQQRIDLCSQLLRILSEWHSLGMTLSRLDISLIYIHPHGFLWIHPALLTLVSKRNSNVQMILEWLYWMLSDHARNFGTGKLALEGLSMRHAMWIRMMVRRDPPLLALYKSWQEDITSENGTISKERAHQLYSNLLLGKVFCDDGGVLAFDLQYALEQRSIWGTNRCVDGKIVGYGDRILLAFFGLHFDRSLLVLDALYQRLVKDEDVHLLSASTDFSGLLQQLKIRYLLRMDWEVALAHILERAESFSEWMDINRFRVLYNVQPDKVVVPEPNTTTHFLELASFFYWFCNDEEEALFWFAEAEKQASEDIFDLFLLIETQYALWGHISAERYTSWIERVATAPIADQLLLCEELEDRLNIRDENWIAQFSFDTTEDRVLWCQSRFATEEEKGELDRYCRDIQEQLNGFSLWKEEALGWEEVVEAEKQLSDQIQLVRILGLHNKEFREQGFVPPPLQPPFSEQYVQERRGMLAALRKERHRQEEERRRKKAQKDAMWQIALILLVFLVGAGVAWLS